MAVGNLGSGKARHGCVLGVFSYDAAGIVAVVDNAAHDLGPGAYDNVIWDTDGYSGLLIPTPLDPWVNSVDNYLTGDGVLTIPPGLAGLYRMHAKLVAVGGSTEGAPPSTSVANFLVQLEVSTAGGDFLGTYCSQIGVNMTGSSGPLNALPDPEVEWVRALNDGDTIRSQYQLQQSNFVSYSARIRVLKLSLELIVPGYLAP